jgi:hypothetical protein
VLLQPRLHTTIDTLVCRGGFLASGHGPLSRQNPPGLGKYSPLAKQGLPVLGGVAWVWGCFSALGAVAQGLACQPWAPPALKSAATDLLPKGLMLRHSVAGRGDTWEAGGGAAGREGGVCRGGHPSAFEPARQRCWQCGAAGKGSWVYRSSNQVGAGWDVAAPQLAVAEAAAGCWWALFGGCSKHVVACCCSPAVGVATAVPMVHSV